MPLAMGTARHKRVLDSSTGPTQLPVTGPSGVSCTAVVAAGRQRPPPPRREQGSGGVPSAAWDRVRNVLRSGCRAQGGGGAGSSDPRTGRSVSLPVKPPAGWPGRREGAVTSQGARVPSTAPRGDDPDEMFPNVVFRWTPRVRSPVRASTPVVHLA